MTAPKPLPRCPVCGDEPMVSILGSPGYSANARVECYAGEPLIHNVSVSALTMRRARALWRRLAGGAK